jgi:hypothetical protein
MIFPSAALRSPVLFLVFNRPDMTQRVFAAIRKVRPARLFIAADGARRDILGEAGLCNQVRRIVFDGIDWPCEVKTLFRDKNLGCKEAVSSAITWFFEQVEEGVILEDDCLPDLSFFRFCQELLDKYRYDERVMMIAGSNFHPEQCGKASYYFSRYTHIWGWATWRRAWQKYDLSMKSWPGYRNQRLLNDFLSEEAAERTIKAFDSAFQGRGSTWDVQWLFACWAGRGVSVVPNINLVSNIDSGGTHMKAYDPCVHLSTGTMAFPLSHPVEIKPNETADVYTQRYLFLRSWSRTVVLIISYLWSLCCKSPRRLPVEITNIIKSLILEARQRLAC